jgi:hypothetical protein
MKMQYKIKLACQFAGSALLLWSYASPALAAHRAPTTAIGITLACLREAEIGVQPEQGVWHKIQVIFEALSPANLAERSRLLELKKKIIEFQGLKEKLIEIVEAHMTDNSGRWMGGGGGAGGGVSERLRLSMIPDVLAQTRDIARELERIARAGSPFAAGHPFDDLERAFEVKYNTDLCSLQKETASPTPDRRAVEAIVQKLRTELESISAAVEAINVYLHGNRPSPTVDHQ